MHYINPTHQTDWLTITVRWLFLLGMALWLAFNNSIIGPVVLVLVLAALMNVFFTVLAGTSRLQTAYRFLGVVADAIFAYLLFWMTGALYGYLVWVGLLPVISASLSFRWVGAISFTLLSLIIQSALALTASPLSEIIIAMVILTPLNLAVGLLFAYISQRLSQGEMQPRKASAQRRTEMDRSERERRRAIFELVSALSSSLNYQRILQTVLDLSTNALSELGAPTDELVRAVLLFKDLGDNRTELQVGTSRLLLPVDTRITLPGTSGVIGHTIDEGVSSLTKQVGSDPELSRLTTLREYQSAYCIPLRTGLDAYGILLFSHPEPEFFTSDRREVLDIVGNQLVIAIQNARLYQDLDQEKERMMEVQEEARQKMARDLHDGPTQSVSAIAMRVNFARRLLDRDPKAAAEELYKIEDLARRTTKEIRLMLFTLRPLVLESQGLIAALESMAEKTHETYNQDVIIQADQRVVDALESGKQAVVFYIVEEAVNNARKHAQAAHIWVRLGALRSDLALLEIEDDGLGFNVNAVDMSYDDRGSLGMVNMRERTELISGILRIDSAEGQGTRIRVVIPLTEEAADRIQHRR